MSRKEAPKAIGSVLAGVLEKARQQHGLLFDIQQQWEQVAGKDLAAHTRPVSIRQGKLVVHVARPSDNFLFRFARPRITKRVNKVTKGKVTEIVVRAGKIAA